jgi:hypothetical protein
MTFKIQVTQVEIETSPSVTPYFVRVLIPVKNSTADGGKCHIKNSYRSYKIECVDTQTKKHIQNYFFFDKYQKKKKI